MVFPMRSYPRLLRYTGFLSGLRDCAPCRPIPATDLPDGGGADSETVCLAQYGVLVLCQAYLSTLPYQPTLPSLMPLTSDSIRRQAVPYLEADWETKEI